MRKRNGQPRSPRPSEPIDGFGPASANGIADLASDYPAGSTTNAPLLEKDYVMLKIDDVRDKNGNDVAQRLYRGQRGGVPFHAIFDASGMMLIDSVGPLGNIGHPSGPEGKQQLRKMLLNTRQDLADADVDQLVESTGD